MTPQASPARAFPEPRADLGLREGYHSPQVPVEVRLNTNESPYPPPPEFLEALVAQVRDVAYNRYPDRSARALREALAELHGLAAPTQGSLIIRCLSADIRLARTVPPSQHVEEIQDGSAEAHRVLL